MGFDPKQQFFGALNMVRSGQSSAYQGRDGEEAYAIRYHRGVRALQDGSPSLLEELRRELPAGHIGRAITDIRLYLQRETEARFAELIRESRIVDRARTVPGPYEIWLIEALRFEAYAGYYAVPRQTRYSILEDVLGRCLEAGFIPGIVFALNNLLGDAEDTNDVDAMTKYFAHLQSIAEAFGDSHPSFRLEVLSFRMFRAGAQGDGRSIVRFMEEITQLYHEGGRDRWLPPDDWLLAAFRSLRGLVRVGNLHEVRKQIELIINSNRSRPLRGYRNYLIYEKVGLSLREWSVLEIQRFLHHLPKQELEDHTRILALCHSFLELRFGHPSEMPLVEILREERRFAGITRTECDVAIHLLCLKQQGPTDAWWQEIQEHLYRAEVEHAALDHVLWLWVEFDGAVVANEDKEKLVFILDAIVRGSVEKFPLDLQVALLLREHLRTSGRVTRKSRFIEGDLTKKVGQQIYEARLQSWPLASYCKEHGLALDEITRDLPPPPESELQQRFYRSLKQDFGRLVSKEKMVRTVWAEAYDPRVHDSRLQKAAAKLREHFAFYGHSPEEIEAVPGRGYRLRGARDVNERLLGETRDTAILAWIERLPPDAWFTTREVALVFHQSQRQAQRDILYLEKQGLLESQGKARAKRYRYRNHLRRAA